MRILITAFEPFGGEQMNTSAEVLRLLPERIGVAEIEKRLLPVVFGKAAEAIKEVSADYVFLMGEAGSRERVTPETTAYNLRDARIPDNEGNQPASDKIRFDGPDTYSTPIPVERIVEQMQREQYPIETSHDPGRYVCNDTFYLTGTGRINPVDFIHVPHRTEELEELADTVRRFVELAMEAPPIPEKN